MLLDDLNNLIKKRDELKEELSNINKKIKNKKCYEYQRKEENLKFCKCCNKNISKYTFIKHERTDGHILKSKLYNIENN